MFLVVYFNIYGIINNKYATNLKNICIPIKTFKLKANTSQAIKNRRETASNCLINPTKVATVKGGILESCT